MESGKIKFVIAYLAIQILCALILSAKSPDLKKKIEENLAKGTFYLNEGKQDSSFLFYQKAEELAKESGNKDWWAFSLNRLGGFFYQMSDMENSLRFYLKADSVSDIINNKLEQAASKSGIARIIVHENDLPKARRLFFKASNLFLQGQDTLASKKMLANVAVTYKKAGMFDSALYYNGDVIRYLEKKKHFRSIAGLHNNQASIFIELGKYEEAEASVRAGLAANNKLQPPSKLILPRLFANLAHSLKERGKPKAAVNVYLKGLSYADTVGNLKSQRNILLELKDLLASEKDFEQAFVYAEKLNGVNDSIAIRSKASELEKMKAAYDWKELKKETLRLKERNIFQKRQKNILLLFILMLLILGGIGIMLFIQRGRLNRILNEKRKALDLYSHQLEVKNNQLVGMDEEKDWVVNMVAHDVRNSFGGVIGMAQLLQLKLESYNDEIVLLEKSAKDGLNLVNQYLDLTRLKQRKSAISIEKCNTLEIIYQVKNRMEIHAESKGIRINGPTVHVPENMFTYSNDLAVTQIVENLLSNAIKFSPAKSSVYIELERKKEYVFIRIIDRGPGILKEEQEKLFQAFSKLSNRPTGGEKSSGLGLAIVKWLVDAVEGNIEYRNQNETGSCFEVRLKAYEKDMQELELVHSTYS